MRPSVFVAVGLFFLYLQFGTTSNYQEKVEKPLLPPNLMNLAEPNQTRWRETIKLPPKMLNLSSPFVSSKAKMVVIVPLHAQMSARRAEIRDSWALSNNSEAVRSGLLTVLFVVTQNPFTDALIREENSRFHDILVVRGEESYKNLVYKLALVYKWVTRYHPNLDVVKVDSDVVVEIDRLYRTINKEIHHHRFVMGYVLTGVQPKRDPFHPWYIPDSIYSKDLLPPYTSGPIYVFSSSGLKAVLLEAMKSRVFEVEDAFFTGVLAAEAGISVLWMEGIFDKMPKKQYCDKDGKSTVVAYPVHYTKLDMRIEYEQMKRIRCMTRFERWFG